MQSWRARLTSVLFWTGLAGLAIWFAAAQLQAPAAPKTDFPLTGEYITVEGAKLYVQAKGEGRVVLFLHAFPIHSESFRGVINQAWPGRRLVILDLPGLGRSGHDDSGRVAPDALALSVKILMDKMGVKDADLVGNDLGGGVALILTALYPNLFKRAVLIAPDSSAGSAAESAQVWWSLPGAGGVWATVFSARGYIRDMLRRSWPDSDRGWENRVELYAAPVDTVEGRRGLLALERGRRDFDYRFYEERLKNPVLLLWGGSDRVLTPARGQALAQRLAQASLEIIPGRGHLPQEEDPAGVYALMCRFLQIPQSPPVQPEFNQPESRPAAVSVPRAQRRKRYALPTPTAALAPVEPARDTEQAAPPATPAAEGSSAAPQPSEPSPEAGTAPAP